MTADSSYWLFKHSPPFIPNTSKHMQRCSPPAELFQIEGESDMLQWALRLCCVNLSTHLRLLFDKNLLNRRKTSHLFKEMRVMDAAQEEASSLIYHILSSFPLLPFILMSSVLFFLVSYLASYPLPDLPSYRLQPKAPEKWSKCISLFSITGANLQFFNRTFWFLFSITVHLRVPAIRL